MCIGNDRDQIRAAPARAEGQRDGPRRAPRRLPRRRPQGPGARPVRRRPRPCPRAALHRLETAAGVRRARRGRSRGPREGPALLPRQRGRRGAAARGRGPPLRGADSRPDGGAAAPRSAVPSPPRRASDRGLLGALPGPACPPPRGARPPQPADLARAGAGPRRARAQAHGRRVRESAAGGGPRHLRHPRRRVRRLVAARRAAGAAGVLRRLRGEDPGLRPTDPAHDPRADRGLPLPCSPPA